MRSRSNLIILILFFSVALIYTIWNYLNGGTDLLILMSAIFICGFSLLNAIRALIDSFKK